jgi:rhodanese-related sulfurtransferase
MPHDIERGRLQQLQAEGAAVVEVMPRQEFKSEHLAGAINLPLEELTAAAADRALGPDKQRALVVYCQGSD